MTSWNGLTCVACLTSLAACTRPATPPPPATGVEERAFGSTPDGAAVSLYTLTNASGVEVRAITYGGIILSLRVPDRDGQLGDVVLGFDALDGYLEGLALLRRHHRALRQPDRARKVHPGRTRSTPSRPTTARTPCTAG